MNEQICPPSGTPRSTLNPPGHASIAYRVGDYLAFRNALLHAGADEVALSSWSPTAKGDLALQVIEWSAYVFDILTFYNERIANRTYIGTADTAEAIARLVALLGYRRRPAIGATGAIGIRAAKDLQLRRGFQVQSKPAPGKKPQVFELDVDAQVKAGDGISSIVIPTGSILLPDRQSILIEGKSATAKKGDRVLFLKPPEKPRPLKPMEQSYDKRPLYFAIQKVAPEKTGPAAGNTRLTFSKSDAERLGGRPAQYYRLVRSSRNTRPWAGPATARAAQPGWLHLQSIVRDLLPPGPVLLHNEVTNQSALVVIFRAEQVIWYLNGSPPDTKPAPATIPIPVPHTRLRFSKRVDPLALGPLDALKVLYGLRDVGTLIPAPVTRVSTSRSRLHLASIPPATYPSASHSKVLVADVNAVGARASVTVDPGQPTLVLESPQPVRAELSTPLRVYFRSLPVSHGATVAGEILGGGDSSIAGQDFTLSKAPVTYLQDAGSRSGPGYSSTVRVWVDGIEWREVQSFYGQARDEHVFVTVEDQSGNTHVLFGDGEQGARLPTGSGNVTATYRYGAGADAPPAGTLTKALRPPQGLLEISNPVGVGGGADAQRADFLRINAPASVLALDRAISADDYEAIAASAPGVTRARSYWAWDSAHQRALVRVYVGDDLQAQTAAQNALDGAIDPNRPVTVQLASPVAVRLSIKIEVDPARANPAAIRAQVVVALADPVDGLFAPRRMRIGQSFYTSQIVAACLLVPGVSTVSTIHVHAPTSAGKDPYRPGPGSYFRLAGKAHVY
jgi:uncharacterized phage protein gp47/JayE